MYRDDATPQQLAYNFIREGILSGKFTAGSWLKTESIAQQLDISRMPVRDALRQLDSEGLVTIRLNRGATVTNLSLEDILELFEIRSVLEGLAAGIAATRATKSHIEELDFLVQQMERAKSDRTRWIERHDAVHDYLCGISGRQELCAQISRLRTRVKPYLLMYSVAHGDPELAGHEHWRFLEPLRNQQTEEAERIVRAHVIANAHSIVADMSKSKGAATSRGEAWQDKRGVA
ncbi:GntR family transcriptional regulator [Microvirga massiliensis]|uniref:GntR family transcriptional regulator n=1 Tax=Microvirga massiliensis TaxID=1033741 RepID=UPI00066150C1|nr:GntR family transcriptional regulator [Microvirga massiliensis]